MKKLLLATALLGLMTSEGMAQVTKRKSTTNGGNGVGSAEISAEGTVGLTLKKDGTLEFEVVETINFTKKIETMAIDISGNLPKKNVKISFVSNNGGLKYNQNIIGYTVKNGENEAKISTATNSRAANATLTPLTLFTAVDGALKETVSFTIELDKDISAVEPGDYADTLTITAKAE